MLALSYPLTYALALGYTSKCKTPSVKNFLTKYYDEFVILTDNIHG